MQDAMQAFIDNALKKFDDQRKASSQFNLGNLMNRLRGLPQDMPILLGRANSYRGYYCDLAFEPLVQPCTVKEARQEVEQANGTTFEGWKGGDYTMARDTPVWYSHRGDVGLKIMGITDKGEILTEADNY
jgi:hypothetical protein